MRWEYIQSSGLILHIDNYGVETEVWKGGYSGNGQGLNNPLMQDVPKVGPIPRGTWHIDQYYNSIRTGPFTIPLFPILVPDAPHRDLRTFRIHGDNAYMNNSASEGCIILPLMVRVQIVHFWRSGTLEFEVLAEKQAA